MPHPRAATRSGITLAESLVAVTVLELAALGLLAALLATRRHDRAARLRAAGDLLRRDTVALEAASPACRAAATPAAVPVALPATAGRPPLVATVRCGR